MATGSCLDTMGHAPPSMMAISHCHGFGNNQVIYLLLLFIYVYIILSLLLYSK